MAPIDGRDRIELHAGEAPDRALDLGDRPPPGARGEPLGVDRHAANGSERDVHRPVLPEDDRCGWHPYGCAPLPRGLRGRARGRLGSRLAAPHERRRRAAERRGRRRRARGIRSGPSDRPGARRRRDRTDARRVDVPQHARQARARRSARSRRRTSSVSSAARSRRAASSRRLRRSRATRPGTRWSSSRRAT